VSESRSQRAVLVQRSFVSLVTATLFAAAGGVLLRDRVAVLSALTYAPVPLIAAAGVMIDVWLRGRAWRRPRFGLSLTCVAVAAWHATGMIGWRSPAPAPPGSIPARVLQWNVRWGGGSPTGITAAWARAIDAIVAESPDLVVLSEAPSPEHLRTLPDALGSRWSFSHFQHSATAVQWYRPAVVAPYPVTLVAEHALADAVGGEFVVAHPERALRVLAVDGPSAPWRDRRPMLAAVLQLAKRASADRAPFDLIVGDFNAPSRSIGFDAYAAAGFTDATSFSGWRGTWRTPLPWLDLDHLFVRNDAWSVSACRHFTGPLRFDHRAIVCDLALIRE
jgi:endonuclease/exonuclease/phosphatase family metal-dependent hydrolase